MRTLHAVLAIAAIVLGWLVIRGLFHPPGAESTVDVTGAEPPVDTVPERPAVEKELDQTSGRRDAVEHTLGDPLTVEQDHAAGDAPLAVYGHVRDGEGVAIPGARVGAVLSGIEERSLGTGTTDAEGLYRFECPELSALHPLTVRGRMLIVAAERAGYAGARRIWNDWPPPTEPLGDVEVDLTLERGRRLFGRIVDSASAPVAGANVRFAYEPSDSPGVSVDTLARSAADGSFCCALKGEPRLLSARSWQHGIAVVSLTGRDEGAGDLDLGDVPLEPLGILDGHAVFRDGRPAPGVLVVAADVEHDGEAVQARQHYWFEEPEDELGLPVGRCTTDAQGAFHLAGLAQRSYVVYAVSRAGTGKVYSGRKVGVWYMAGTRGIEVVVDFPRLVVELVDEEGTPIPGLSVKCDEVERAEDGQLSVVDQRFGTTAEDGTVDFEVAPGLAYRLSASVRGVSAVTEAFDVPADVEELRRVLVLETEAGSGRLRIVIHARDGSIVRDGVVRLLHTETDESLGLLSWTDADAEGWWRVPAGIYDVEIELNAFDQLDAHELLVAPVRGVKVPVGGERELRLRPHVGGRFRLVWRSPSGTFPPEGIGVPSPALQPTASALFQSEHGARARVRRIVADAARQEEEYWWSCSFAHDPQQGYHGFRLLPDGEYRCRLLLEPGQYTLRLECPGFDTRDATIAISAGEETAVELSLEPR